MRETVAIEEHNLQALLTQLTQQIKLRRPVRLCIARHPIGPLTYGWLRPVIVLPQELISARSAEELEPLVAHELVHIRRGDALVGWLQVAAQCLWWFHPLVWWANRQISYERERSCDEEVVAGFGFLPAHYARSLLGVLDLKLQMRWLSKLPGIRPMEITKQRLEHVMLHASRFQVRMPRWYWLLAVLALLLFAPGAPFNSSTPQVAAAPQDQNQHTIDAVAPKNSGETMPGSAAAMIQAVYDSFNWIDGTRTLRIRTEYKIVETPEELAWDDKQSIRNPIAGKLDPRPFYASECWAWDEKHVFSRSRTHYEGEGKYSDTIRIWDDKLWVECMADSEKGDKQYVLGDKLAILFKPTTLIPDLHFRGSRKAHIIFGGCRWT